MATLWLLSIGAGVASARAFLVGSDPPQGARLAHAPSTITLSFSEDVDTSATATSAPIRAGLLASVAGGAMAFLDEAGGGGSGLSHAALLSGVATLLAATFTRHLLPVLVVSVAAGVAWAADSYPALVLGAVGLVVNAVHLVVGVLWACSLAFMVAAVVRYRAERAQLMAVTRHYARLALPLVVVLGAAGGLSALETLPSFSSPKAASFGTRSSTSAISSPAPSPTRARCLPRGPGRRRPGTGERSSGVPGDLRDQGRSAHLAGLSAYHYYGVS